MATTVTSSPSKAERERAEGHAGGDVGGRGGADHHALLAAAPERHVDDRPDGQVPRVRQRTPQTAGRDERDDDDQARSSAASTLTSTALPVPVRLAAGTDPSVTAIMDAHPLREGVTTSGPWPLRVQRRRALVGSWYEFFPRSEGAVRRKDGTWLAAPPLDGTWVVNVADMLSRWTNGRWQSTPHRVKNLSGGDRYSNPYFYDMSLDAIVEVVPTCQGPGNPAKWPPVRYGDYLLERLDKNYAYRQPDGATA
mgnify:CR=1 FL=1